MTPAGRSFVTSRPVAILMVFLAAFVFGTMSLGRLPVTLMPELTYPTLTVRTEYPGAAPEEVENDISRPIEEQLGVIAGLSKISSVSRAGVSDVVLEFAWDTEMSDATQDVLEKLDLVFLPEEANRPLILHYDPSLDPKFFTLASVQASPVRLYGNPANQVECGTCHDPHDRTTAPYFLRLDNAGSNICYICHDI